MYLHSKQIYQLTFKTPLTFKSQTAQSAILKATNVFPFIRSFIFCRRSARQKARESTCATLITHSCNLLSGSTSPTNNQPCSTRCSPSATGCCRSPIHGSASRPRIFAGCFDSWPKRAPATNDLWVRKNQIVDQRPIGAVDPTGGSDVVRLTLSNSLVASLPTPLINSSIPPGWKSMYCVTLKTIPGRW